MTAYFIPQSLFKIHPDNDALIADVLARDPSGRGGVLSRAAAAFQRNLPAAARSRLRRARRRLCIAHPFPQVRPARGRTCASTSSAT
jgi:hypothetical protein